MKRRVLISGAGIAGILCVLSLDKEKYDVEIIEKADNFRHVGFSFMMWKSGFDSLVNLLKRNNTNLVEGKDYFKTEKFSVFIDVPLKKSLELNANHIIWTFERGQLMKSLEKMLSKQFGKNIVTFRRTVKNIIQQANTNATVIFNDGSKKDYDIVIIAEGIDSKSREILFPEAYIDSFSHDLTYAWFDTKTNLGHNGVIFFTKGFLGIIHPPFFKNLLGYYSKNDQSQSARRQFEKEISKLIRQPNGDETKINIKTSNVFQYIAVKLKQFHKGNVVVIGDAAHGNPPTIGFGASLAIEDVILLSKFLNEFEIDNTFYKHLSNKLKEFSERRTKRISEVYRFQKITHSLLITENFFKVKIISSLGELFLAKFIMSRLQKLARYEVLSD